METAMSRLKIALILVISLFSSLAMSQSVDERLEMLDMMIPQHAGQLGALTQENINKPRPAPAFDLTGTWFPDLTGDFNKWLFGADGYPEFIGQAKLDFEEGQRAMAEQRIWRDSIGQCFPAGIPMLMTRVWPIAMIQIPTAVYMVSNFNNGFRQVFLDGRDYSDPDTIIYTYNGESIGHWEGDTLVVNTQYIEPYNHFIDFGIPISDEFKVQERIKLQENGRQLEIEYVMTDPQGWVGEWRSTKHFLLLENTEIGEVECLPDLNDNIPSTQTSVDGLD